MQRPPWMKTWFPTKKRHWRSRHYKYNCMYRVPRLFPRNILPSLFLSLAVVFSLPFAARASETDGTINGSSLYAWGETIGWINFGTLQGNVHVFDEGLTGYAWGANVGWIHLDPSLTSRVLNDGEGNLSGHAWGEVIGWINFEGVTISDNGAFLGYATVLQDGSLISFNCANTDSCAASDFHLETDWRPVSVREGEPSSGGTVRQAGSRRPAPPSTSASSPTTPESPAVVPVPVIPEPSFLFLIDIIKDGVFDILDFNEMMVEWGQTQCGVDADMTSDCVVNVLDFNLLMVYWGLTYTL